MWNDVNENTATKPVNRQGLHEGQGEQQDTSQVICNLRLAGDAINASAGCNALTNTRTDGCKANGEAGANGGQGRDPNGALISECCLWCHQGGRGQSCCSSSACGRRRHMRAARGRHEGRQECSAAQQHGTGHDEGASHRDNPRLWQAGTALRCLGSLEPKKQADSVDSLLLQSKILPSCLALNLQNISVDVNPQSSTIHNKSQKMKSNNTKTKSAFDSFQKRPLPLQWNL